MKHLVIALKGITVNTADRCSVFHILEKAETKGLDVLARESAVGIFSDPKAKFADFKDIFGFSIMSEAVYSDTPERFPEILEVVREFYSRGNDDLALELSLDFGGKPSSLSKTLLERFDRELFSPAADFLSSLDSPFKILFLLCDSNDGLSGSEMPFFAFSGATSFSVFENSFTLKNAKKTGISIEGVRNLLFLLYSLEPVESEETDRLQDGHKLVTDAHRKDSYDYSSAKRNTEVVLNYISSYDRSERVKKSFYKGAAFLYDWLEMLLISCCCVLFLFSFVMRPTRVIGASMETTLLQDDLLIVSDLFYTPEQGDIIVFQNHASGRKDPIVKRVIAVSGEWIDIEFHADKTMSVKVAESEEALKTAEPLDESDHVRFDLDTAQVLSDHTYPLRVPEDCYFCMGDNRNHSLDSRSYSIGFVKRDTIIGKVIFRMLPLERLGLVR